jgi:propanediol dehydratase small subunit
VTDSTLETLRVLQELMNEMPARRAELIAEARAAGHSWPKIAEALGMTHPGAMKAAKAKKSRADMQS